MKYKLFVNVGHVDYHGIRLWCNGVLIDMEQPKFSDGKPMGSRQIRGLSWGGMPVFTFWVPEGVEPEIISTKGGSQVLLSHDGKMYNLDSGVTIRIGMHELGVVIGNFRKPLKVVDIASYQCPFGDEFDELVLPYSGGSNYPKLVWQRVPAKFEENP